MRDIYVIVRWFLLMLASFITLSGPSPLNAAEWPMQGHDPQSTNFSPHVQAISPHTIMRLHSTWTITGVSQIVAAGGRLYVSYTAGRGVGVLDAHSGRQIRRFTDRQLGLSTGDNVNALAYNRGLLLVASFLQIVAVTPTHGRIVWRRSGGADALVPAGGMVYTGQSCQTGCETPASEAIDLGTGQVVWRHPGNFGGRPVLIRGRLYQSWGEAGGNTRVYDPGTGRLLRTLTRYGQWIGDTQRSYLVHGNGYPFGPRRAQLLARITADGREAWRVLLGRTGQADPALAYGRLFLTSNRFHPGILAINASDGHVAWGTTIAGVTSDNAPSIMSVIVVNHLVLVAAGPHLDVLDAGSGRLLRQMPSHGYDIQRLVFSDGVIYPVSTAGVTAVMP